MLEQSVSQLGQTLNQLNLQNEPKIDESPTTFAGVPENRE